MRRWNPDYYEHKMKELKEGEYVYYAEAEYRIKQLEYSIKYAIEYIDEGKNTDATEILQEALEDL